MYSLHNYVDYLRVRNVVKGILQVEYRNVSKEALHR